MTPKVSVVMPVYNGERFVGDAVDSILNQTLKDLELIVVDDASTDRTPEILDAFAVRDSRVRLARFPANRGAIEARNHGLQLAAAGLVAAMDADDVSLPNRLERQAGFLSQHPDVGVLGSYVQLIDEAGARGAIKIYPTTPGLAAWSLLFFNSVAHPSAMVRRSVLQILDGYPKGCKGGTEDFELFSRASRVTKIANVPEVLMLYRKWQGNMTSLSWQKQEDDADRIVLDSVTALVGPGCGSDIAKALRGLATDSYPRTVAEIKTLGELIPRLCAAFLSTRPLRSTDHADVRLDAAVKLWLLAALAARRQPAMAARFIGTATRTHAGSVAAFAVKVARRLAAGR